MNKSPYYSCGRWKEILPPKFQGKWICGEKQMAFVDGKTRPCDPGASNSDHIQMAMNKPALPTRLRLPFFPFAILVICSVLLFSPSSCYADFLQAARREQRLRQHLFASEATSEPFGHDHAKRKLVTSLGLSNPEDEVEFGNGSSPADSSVTNTADSYSDILEILERIVRQEDTGRERLHIKLEPLSSHSGKEEETAIWGSDEPEGHSRRLPSQLQNEPLGVLSAVQVSDSADGDTTKTPAEESQESVQNGGNESVTQSSTVSPSESHGMGDQNPHVLVKVVNEFHVIEEENALDKNSLVTVVYNFPLQTMESKQIAFVVLALPPRYTARKDVPVCDSLDPEMPPLSCTTRKAYMKNRRGSLSTFVTISSANYMASLPLGRHSFRLAVHTPTESLSTDDPANWWFATFRFTGGHAITKHWENRKLIIKRNCVWGQWRQETPCSTTCGEGYEVWTRNLYSGDSDEACGGAVMKRRCRLQECSLNCQLGEWVTMADCTKSCEATDIDAFKIRMRRVLLHKVGWGEACADLYPWDYQLGLGWSEKMQAVLSISPCEKKFRQPCPATLGCRVEETNTRTIPDAFPWGACPFPCGGFGTITSIVQVANGIPRWIGEKHFPESFQIPCKADKEPLVTTRKCNIEACEDCSVYIENPIFGRATRAWFFFIPTAEADIAEVTAPRGVTIVDSTSQSVQGGTREFKISSLSDVLPPAYRLAREKARLTPPTAEDVLSDAEELGTCANMATSFGAIEFCRVFPSKHYAGSQTAELKLKSLIEPNIVEEGAAKENKHGNTRPQWFALPVLLGKREEMEDAGNFYLWLTRSKFPNDPEVFKCHLRTSLGIPRSCKFDYRPKDPKDCKKCKPGSHLRIETYRKFVPSVNGGTCDVPHALQTQTETVVKTSCVKSCSQLHQKEGAERRFIEEHVTRRKREQATVASRLQRMSRTELETFSKGQVLLKAAAKAGDKFALTIPEIVFGATLRAVDDASMPLIGEETGELISRAGAAKQNVLGQTSTSTQKLEPKATFSKEAAADLSGRGLPQLPPSMRPTTPESPVAPSNPQKEGKGEIIPQPEVANAKEAAPEKAVEEATPAASAAGGPTLTAEEKKEVGAPVSEKEAPAAAEKPISAKEPAMEEQTGAVSSAAKKEDAEVPEGKEEDEREERPAESEGRETEGSEKLTETEPQKEGPEDKKTETEGGNAAQTTKAALQGAQEEGKGQPKQEADDEEAEESSSEKSSQQSGGSESEAQEEEPEE